MKPPAAPVRAAALLVTKRCLGRGRSLFTPSAPLWTGARLDDLSARLGRAAARADAPGGQPAGFPDRWRRTLARADAASNAVAAELLYVHLLFPSDVSAARKRALLAETLGRLPGDTTLPASLDAALDGGIAPAGVAYSRRRLSQLAWLAGAAATLQRLSPAERRATLAEPRRTARALAEAPVSGGDPQRAALLHLLHPETFPPVVSGRARRAILRAFAGAVPDGEPNPDCALAAVWASLATEYGQGFSFFAPEIAARWQ